MAKRVQRRRGTTTEHSTFTGAVGEITVDTTKDVVVVHDGSQVGGFPLAREDMNNVVLTNLIGVNELNLNDGTAGQVITTDGAGTISFGDAAFAFGGDLSGTIGNAQLIANAVGTTELAADAVTGAKLADNACDSEHYTDGSIDAVHIANNTITATQIAASTITSTEILNGTIVADDLAINSVTTDKILDANVSDTKLSNDAVTNVKIANNAVTTAKIATNAVTAIEIAANAVGSSEIADNSINGTKIALGSDTQGDVMYYDGTNWERLPAGTSGYALVSGGTGANPSWSQRPYDMTFLAGFNKDMVKENITVRTYGELVMARAGTFEGEQAYIDTVCTGTVLIMDIMKNGTTIYSTNPQFAVSTATHTAGTLSVTSFVAGDRITFKVTQIGSTVAGQGVRFTLKCKV